MSYHNVMKGSRIELVFTNDEYTNLRPGDRGVVTMVRVELGSPKVHVKWDNGSTLSLIEDAGDRFRVVPE